MTQIPEIDPTRKADVQFMVLKQIAGTLIAGTAEQDEDKMTTAVAYLDLLDLEARMMLTVIFCRCIHNAMPGSVGLVLPGLYGDPESAPLEAQGPILAGRLLACTGGESDDDAATGVDMAMALWEAQPPEVRHDACVLVAGIACSMASAITAAMDGIFTHPENN